MAFTHTYIIRNRIPPMSIVHHPPARNFDRLAVRKMASMMRLPTIIIMSRMVILPSSPVPLRLRLHVQAKPDADSPLLRMSLVRWHMNQVLSTTPFRRHYRSLMHPSRAMTLNKQQGFEDVKTFSQIEHILDTIYCYSMHCKSFSYI